MNDHFSVSRVYSSIARALLVSTLILAMIAETAEARKRRHHRYHGHHHAHAQREPLASPANRLTARAERRNGIAALIPRDWQLEPADPNWQGHRFSSPAGNAWLALYARSAEDERREHRLMAVAFAEGEEITYLHSERDWLAVSGVRGDQIFYRKVVLACGERQWRHVAFEYPAREKREFNQLIRRMSRALDRARHEDCPPQTSTTESAPRVE